MSTILPLSLARCDAVAAADQRTLGEEVRLAVVRLELAASGG
jgi:hypothetical protein